MPKLSTSAVFRQIDPVILYCYLGMVFFGWLTVYAAVYDPEMPSSIFNPSLNSGKQFIFILVSIAVVFLIMIADFRLFSEYAYLIFGIVCFLLVAVLFFGKEVAGSKSWFVLGPVRLQPAEFAKVGVALALARLLGENRASPTTLVNFSLILFFLAFPALLIQKQGDTGTALVFASFFIMLYREGMWSWFVLLGLLLSGLFIAILFLRESYILELYIFVFVVGLALLVYFLKLLWRYPSHRWRVGVLIVMGTLMGMGLIRAMDFIIGDVMKEHQRKRLEAFIDPDSDPKGSGYNVRQSMVAIGSGGLEGKGFLEGTQTKLNFVPAQSTDFIFCTIGEEEGFWGATIVILLYIILIIRIIFLAERQKNRFTRVYGYAVASLFMFHFIINIGMTMGMMPVIGIPLPFFSYGGSAMLSFSVLLFIFVKLDVHKLETLIRR
jgi:rod shape determining protein RodA